MANVLPLDAQKKLWRTHSARFIAVWALVAITLAFAAGLSLVPSFVTLELNSKASDSSPEATTAAEGLRSMTKAQAYVNAVLPVIASTSTKPTEAMEKAISLRPKGVTVDRVRFVGGTTKQIIMQGSATREQLTAYRDALEADGLFTGVSVPVGALFGDTGRFSVTLVGHF